MAGSELEGIVEQYHLALDAFIQGDPSLQKGMFSRREDVSLANPIGPPAVGRANVEETMDRAAAQLKEGEPTQFRRICGYTGEDLAFIVETERAFVKVGGSDTKGWISLRVTTIFRLEDGTWKVVHRHADPIVSPRPIESILES